MTAQAHIFRTIGLVVGLALAAGSAAAQPSEAQVKAAFLAKFAPFVGWPPGAESQIPLLCLQGDDAVVQSVVAAAAAGVLPGAIRRMGTVDAAARCSILYAAGSTRQSTGEAIASVRNLPVLTVTDDRNGGARGMIHFVIMGDRVRFYIDQGQAARARLSISSKLLALALSVKP